MPSIYSLVYTTFFVSGVFQLVLTFSPKSTNDNPRFDSSESRLSAAAGSVISNQNNANIIQPKRHEEVLKKSQNGIGGSLPLEKKDVSEKDDLTSVGFIHAFAASISVIIVSELGDKTFFIAAIMAMRHSRVTVFIGAISALVLMTVLSALLGFATTVIPRSFTYYASSFLFALFGLKMLKEGYYMSPDEGQEEYEEVQADLRKRDDERQKESVSQDPESGIIRISKGKLFGLIPRILVEAFTLTFLAEWGDRSQITTIILAARENVAGVIIGGSIGHAFCTGLAVIGGRFIAQRISVRTVTLIGGVVFIIFAVSAFFVHPS